MKKDIIGIGILSPLTLKEYKSKQFPTFGSQNGLKIIKEKKQEQDSPILQAKPI
jgi:hypothetical protein